MSKPIVDVGIRIDISDQIKDLERQLDSLSNRAGSKMTKGMADQVASIQQAIKELQAQFNSINTNKLNRKTFEDLSKGLIKQIDSIDQRTTALEQEMAALVGTMSKHVGDAFKKDLDSFSRSMATTTQNAKEAVGAIDHLYSTFNKTQNVRTYTGIDSSSLEKEAKKLSEIERIIDDINNFNFDGEQYTGSTKKLAQELDELVTQYLALEKTLNSTDLPVEEYNKFALELVETAKKIKVLQDNASDSKYDDVFKLDFSGVNLNEILGQIDETIDAISQRIQSRLEEIKREAAGITSTISSEIEKRADGTSETKRLTVPLDISTGVNTLVQRAKEIVDKTQPHLNNYPLKLQFVLQSGYSSKKTNKLLSQVQSEIDSLPEQVNKSGLQELFDSIAKDFSGDKELNIKIKTNALSETEANINNTIKKIRTTVEKPMEIHPSVVMDEKVTKKLQRELNRVSKELVLNVNTINLFGKDQKGFDEVKSIVSVIDMIMSKAEETKLQTTYVWQVLVDIREILKTLTLQENIAEVKTLVDTLSDFLASIQTAYKVLNSNDLDNMFAGIQQRVQSISGALRGNNLKEIKSVLAQFEQYQKLGGTKSFKDLGGTDNIQGWLSRNVKEINAAKDWYEAGKDFGQGYVKGIQDQIPEVEDAAKKMVEAALAAVQATQDSHSAAKKTRKLGNDFGAGYVEGITEKTAEIKAASKKAAKEALQGLSEGMADTTDNSLISNITPAIDEIKGSVKDVASTVESSIDNIEERLMALLSGKRVSSKKLNELLGYDAYPIYQAGRKSGDSKEGIAKTLLQHATTLKQASNAEEMLQSSMDETQEELDQTSAKVEKVTQKLDAMTAAIGRLTSRSGSYNVASIKEVLDGITVTGTTKKGHTVRDNARRSLQAEAEWINSNKFEDANWENAYKHYLKFIQLFDIYKKNGGTKETLSKYQAYYDRIIGNADTMRTSLTNLLSKLPTDTAANGFKEVEQASESMGSEAQQEIKATAEEVTKLLVTLQLAKKSMLDLSKAEGVSGDVHKKMGVDEYYYSPKSKSAELSESELALKDAIKTMNEAIVNLRRAGITLFNGVPKMINNSGSALLSDSSLRNLYSLGKHDKNVSLIANALDKYRDTGDQEILKYIQDLASKTKFSKFKKLNGSAIKKELLSNINNILNPSEEKASVKMTQEASASLDDLVSKSQKASKVTSDVSVSQKEATKSTEKLTATIKEQASAQEKQIDISQTEAKKTVATEKEKQKAIEKTTATIKEQSEAAQKTELSIDEKFDKLKAFTTKYAKPRANAEQYPTYVSKIVDQYQKYEQAGGTKPISELTKSKTVLADLTAEYKKQTQEVVEEAKKVVDAEEKKQSSVKKTTVAIKEQASTNKKSVADKSVEKKTKQTAQHTSEVAKNTAEIKKNTQAAKENAELSIDEKFDKLKAFTSKYAKPKANAQEYPAYIAKIAEQYQKYMQSGGTRPIEDLSKSKTVIADLTAAYEKQTQKIDENTNSKKENNRVVPKEQTNSAIEQTSLQIDEETNAKKKKTDATKKSTEATKEESKAEGESANQTKKTAEAEEKRKRILDELAAVQERVYKNEIHNANGSVTSTDYIDHFRTRTSTKGYDKDGNPYYFESTKENYVDLEKQIQRNDKAIIQLTKDMLLNAQSGSDISAWKNRIDALEEYNRVLLKIRNNGWVESGQFLPEEFHADVFDAERLKSQEKDWENVVADAQKRLKGFVTETEKISSKPIMSGLMAEVTDLRSAFTNLAGTQIDFKNPNIDVVKQQVVDFLVVLSKLEEKLRDVRNKSSQDDFIPVSISEVKAQANNIQAFLDNNTAAGKKSKEALRGVYDELRRIIDTGDEISKVRFDALIGSVQDAEAEVRRLHQTGNSFFRSFMKQLKSANAQFFATYFSLMDIIRYIRAVATTVTEVDSALTELRKVSDASTERLVQNFETSAKTAKELGSTITHVINVTADWARLGYSVDEAEKLARITTLFTTVGDNMSSDDASSYMISTLQGFQLATEEAERIVDVYNEVANNFAIDTRGIGEAISRSAASFNAANTELEGAVAVITAANTVVQNPEAIGTAMKTLSARIRGSKVELEELGEEEVDVTNLTSKLRKEVQAMTGFDIMEDDETYKSIDQIIIGIGEHWKDLSDIQQAALAEDLAGKRNSNVLISLLQNAELVEEVYERALDAEGSAAKEQENYAKSIQYSLDRFTATLQELEADVLNSQFLKGVIDFGTSIIEVLDSIIEHVGLLGSTATIGGIALFVSKFKDIKDTFTATQAIFNAMNLVETGVIDSQTLATEKLAAATNGLTYAQAKEILVLAGWDEAATADILAKAGLTAGNGAATISVEAFTAALWANVKALGAWLVTNPVGWCILAAGAVAGVVVAFDTFTVSVKESQERIDEYNDTIKELSSELEELRKLENKTSYDNKRIEYLEKQLDIQKRLLEVEQQRYYLNLTEKSFGNAFDSDNIASQQARDTNNFQNRNSTANNIRSVEGYVERLVEIQQEIDSLNTDLGNASTEKEQQKILSKIEKLDKERKRIESGGGADRYSDLLDKYQLYLGQEEQLVDALTAKTSSGQNMLTGKARDDAIAELDFARTKMREITEAAREYEIATNSFDPFNTITGIVSEKAFKEEDVIAAINSTDGVKAAQERLIKQFPFLTSLCEKYGITLEDLVSHYWEEKEAIEAVEDAEKKRENSLSTAVSNMNTRILPQFDALEKVYDEIFNGDKEFDLSQIGTDDLESIRSTFEDLDESLNIDWGSKTEDVDKFLSVIGNSSSTASEVHDAFDDLATSYFNAAVSAEDFTEENAQVLEQMLKEMGVINASDVVKAVRELRNIPETLSQLKLPDDFDEGVSDAVENLENEFAKLEDPEWGISAENIQKVKDGTIQSVFGNVDMDKRAIITWSEELKKEYKRELDSWEYDPEIGSIDTVFGGSGGFSLGNGQELTVAFTPIIETDKGAEMVAYDTLMDYIQTIVDQATEDGNWSLDEILSLDQKGIEYDRYDEYGNKIGKQLVKGVIAGVGSDAIEIGSLMHFSGEEGAVELAKEEIEAYESVKKKLEEGTLSLENVTAQEIAVLEKEGIVSAETAKQIALLKLQKILNNENWINESNSISQIIALARAAGIAIPALAALAETQAAISNAQMVLSGEIAGNRVQALKDLQYYTWYGKELGARVANEVSAGVANIDYGHAKEDAGKGGSETGDAYVEAFEKELEDLEEQRDAGVLSEKEFLDRYKALIEKYFKDVDGYGEEYAKRMGDYFQRAISYYESVFSAVGTLLDKRVSAAQEGKDAAVSAIEAERDAVLAAYDQELEAIDALIDAKQDELDRLRDEHDQRARNLSLMKAQYELQRAQQQKVRLIYKDGQMVKIVPSINDTISVKG